MRSEYPISIVHHAFSDLRVVGYTPHMPQPDQSKPQQEPIEKPRGFDAILRRLLGTPPRPKKAQKPPKSK